MANEDWSSGDRAVSNSAAQTGNATAPIEGTRAITGAIPLRTGGITIRALIDLYMAEYAGRDVTRPHRLNWWSANVGGVTLQDLSDDHVHVALEALANQPNRYFAGRDADQRPIYKARGKPLAAATLNRYAAALAAVVTWAIKRRIAPKGYVHPCRTIERRTENNEKIRFLSDDERIRLLEACKRSGWSRLYLLVMLALTTGARRSELMGLRWHDIDLVRGLAHCGRTKNGDAKALPLVPAVIEMLEAVKGKPAELVFASRRLPDLPYAFEGRWREALKEARLRNFRFHDLRHSCASMLAQNGATLLEIGDVLGHRQLAMTKRYSHLTTGHKAALVNRVLGDIK